MGDESACFGAHSPRENYTTKAFFCQEILAFSTMRNREKSTWKMQALFGTKITPKRGVKTGVHRTPLRTTTHRKAGAYLLANRSPAEISIISPISRANTVRPYGLTISYGRGGACSSRNTALSPASRELSQRESLGKVAFARRPPPVGEVAAEPTERASARNPSPAHFFRVVSLLFPTFVLK